MGKKYVFSSRLVLILLFSTSLTLFHLSFPVSQLWADSDQTSSGPSPEKGGGNKKDGSGHTDFLKKLFDHKCESSCAENGCNVIPDIPIPSDWDLSKILPRTSKPISKAECKAACPCCDEQMPKLWEAVEDYNDALKDLEDSSSYQYDWDEIRKLIKKKSNGAQMTQSDDRATQKKGQNLYQKNYEELQELEQFARDLQDSIKDQIRDLNDAAGRLKDLIKKFLACECLQKENCPLSELKYQDRQIDQLPAKIEEIEKYTSNFTLGTLSAALDMNQDAVDAFERNREKFKEALKNINPIDEKSIEKLDLCCKKGSEECWADYMDRTAYFPIDWLLNSWMVDVSLTGYDVATGKFGEIKITNHTKEKLSWVIPVGTVLFPWDETVQRMVIIKRCCGTLCPGESVTIPLEGVCADKNLFPPPSGAPTSDFSFGPILPSINNLDELIEGLPDVSKLFDFSWLDSGTTQAPSDPTSFEDLLAVFDVPDMIEFIKELLTTPYLQDIISKIAELDGYLPTGLPPEMEASTLLQWAVWNIFGGFDLDDGEAQITGQVKETGGTQTKEDIQELNEGLWSNVDLVKKKAKQKIFETQPRKDSHLNVKQQAALAQVPKDEFYSSISAPLTLVKEAEADDMPTFEQSYLLAFSNVKRVSLLLSMVQHLVFDMESLTTNSYAKKINKTAQKDIPGIRRDLKQILKQVRLNHQGLFEQAEFDLDLMLKLNQVNTSLLMPAGDLALLWDKIDTKMENGFQHWDQAYNKLAKKMMNARKKGKKPEDVLSSDEFKFVRIFTRIKLYYHVLSRIYP